jgi:hypothetical protein
MTRIYPGVFTRSNISTPTCVGVPDGCIVPEGKVPQLDLLVQQLLLKTSLPAEADEEEARTRVVFLDDSEENVLVRVFFCCA